MRSQILTTRPLRILFGASALGALLSMPVPTLANDGKNHIGASAAGNYLAGRHAEQVNEDAAALAFYGIAARQKQLGTADLYRRIYFLALTEGRIDDALQALLKAEKQGAHAPFANLVRAAHALKISNFGEVENLLKNEKSGISSLLAPAMIAWAKVGQNNHSGALQALAKMNDKSSLQALHNLYAAMIQEHAGNVKTAEENYLSFLEKAGMSVRVTQLLGWHYERLGQVEKAREHYAKFSSSREGVAMWDLANARIKAKKRPPLDVATPQAGAAEALFNIASILQAQSGDDRVLVLAHLALYLRPDLVPAKLVIASTLESAQRYHKAIALYKNVAKDNVYGWAARMSMADSLDRIDKTDEAVRLLKSLARERPDQENPLIEMGDILRRHERFKEAAEAYTDALNRIDKIDERHWTLFYARGIAYEQTKRWAKAEQDFLKALEFNPEQPLVLNYLGYSWIDQGLHLDRALKMIEKAVDLRPRDGYILDSLGWGLYRLGKFDEAVKKMERAVMLRPADPVINDHLGDALWQVGRKREARFQWDRARTMEPDPDLAKALDQKLKDGLADPAI